MRLRDDDNQTGLTTADLLDRALERANRIQAEYDHLTRCLLEIPEVHAEHTRRFCINYAQDVKDAITRLKGRPVPEPKILDLGRAASQVLGGG